MAVETDPATTHSVENAAEASAAGVGQHGATTEAAHGSSGLPQFQFEHWGGQIAYLLILFAILYILMSKVFAPRMRRVFDERVATIDEALTSARAFRRKPTARPRPPSAPWPTPAPPPSGPRPRRRPRRPPRPKLARRRSTPSLRQAGRSRGPHPCGP